VQCWGNNEHGQLGAVPGTLEANPGLEPGGSLWTRSYLGPSTVAGLPKAARIVAGCSGTCAETVAGEVYCWGHRRAIGDGEESFRSQARAIADPKTGWPQLPSGVADQQDF
jgi:alpha-tubulin suppressor-like RCC1 family protein